MIVHEEHPYNAESPPAALLGEPITATDTFYSRNHGPIPQIDPDRWRLRIGGLLEHERELSLAELQEGFEAVTVAATLQCAGNRRAGFLTVRDIPGEDPWAGGATSTATWTGVRLRDVLASVGLASVGVEAGRGSEGTTGSEGASGSEHTSGAGHVCFNAPDVSQLADPPQAYGGSIPLDKAMSPEVLLAWEMNGEPLTPVHGAPLRVVVPGWIGARSVKWLTSIVLSAEPSPDYFQATAYRLLPPEADPGEAGPGDGLSLGPVALNCEILSPVQGDAVDLTEGFSVAGYAFAGQDRRVARVDVSVDGGRNWRQADLEEPLSDWTWQHWTCRVSDVVVPGSEVISVVARAWDDTGALQPREAADLWNPKGYVNNSWPSVQVHHRGRTG
ncbi:sulfite oxidase [Kineococcus endophyticus]|uniref:Sulfite oxidase n=1 Tax=Kineococcus endophyticus TaxID=1181883 RepID=A0ABV3PCT5_9ACTN